MRCPACQNENLPTASVCVKCGAELPVRDFSDASLGTIYEVSAGTGGEPTGLSSAEEGPTAQVGVPLAAVVQGAIPERFENYQLLRKPDGTIWELGRGAMGITYKAFDTDLHVEVVLKVINPAALANADSRERFSREARAAARLRHANIATVFRLGQANGVQFYAMEYCDGETVHQLVERQGPLELKLALEIALQVTNALVVAQEHGVVHRDIKPSNLMITGRLPEEFTIKVIDFGLAKLGAPGTTASDVTVGSDRTGFVGTAHFASPEQLEDRPVDFRSDIYSLGVTLYFMLSGRPLFSGSMARVVMQHLMQKPPLEKISGLPKCLGLLLEQMLAKDAESRPASTRELRSAIRSCLETPLAKPIPTSTPPIATPDVTVFPPVPDAPDSSLRFAPPSGSPRSESSAAAKEEGASRVASSTGAGPGLGAAPPPPAVVPLPIQPAAPPPLPAARRAEPVSNPAFFIVGAVIFLLILGLVASLLTPFGKRLFTHGNGTAAPTPPPASEVTPDPELEAAARDAQNMQDAAEKLSLAMHNREVNRKLVEIVEKRVPPDPAAIQSYRLAEEAIERNILDAETTYVVAAKRLKRASDETRRLAFSRVADDVSSAGLNWRTRVTEIIQKDLPLIPPDAMRMEAATRNELKRLQDAQ